MSSKPSSLSLTSLFNAKIDSESKKRDDESDIQASSFLTPDKRHLLYKLPAPNKLDTEKN